MDISCFDDLLLAARQQSQPQRLLLVFTNAELPDDSTPAQRESYLAGSGGALLPMMCVDKTPDELTDFATLKAEAQQFDAPWQVMFASTLSGANNIAPSAGDAESALNGMVESIKRGALANMIGFDANGSALVLD